MLRKEQNDLLTQTGPNTPMGEMFRLTWQPALAGVGLVLLALLLLMQRKVTLLRRMQVKSKRLFFQYNKSRPLSFGTGFLFISVL